MLGAPLRQLHEDRLGQAGHAPRGPRTGAWNGVGREDIPKEGHLQALDELRTEDRAYLPGPQDPRHLLAGPLGNHSAVLSPVGCVESFEGLGQLRLKLAAVTPGVRHGDDAPGVVHHVGYEVQPHHSLSEGEVSLLKRLDELVRDLDRALGLVEAPTHGLQQGADLWRQSSQQACKLLPLAAPQPAAAGRLPQATAPLLVLPPPLARARAGLRA
mmetsp:Transcript_31442/g.98645  ORF Transcript_31442/g.98645 Transcript_31442/m.98645 type:complete len:214 (-) Transcript_31442:921-1562(-)